MRKLLLLGCLVLGANGKVQAQDVVMDATTAPASQPLTLRLNLQAGTRHAVRMSMQMKNTTVVNPQQKVEFNQTMNFGYDTIVRSVDQYGAATIDTTFRSVQFSMQMPDARLIFDSAKPNAPLTATTARAREGERMLRSMFGAFIGQTITVKVSPKGEVWSVQGFERLLQNMVKSIKTRNERERKEMQSMFNSILKQQLNKDSMKNMTGLAAAYPANPVAIGESWNQTQSATMFGSTITSQNTYTLQSRQNGIATIAYKSTIKAPAGGTPTTVGGNTIRSESTFTQNGTMQLEEATGWTRSMQSQMRGVSKTRLSSTNQGVPNTSSTSYLSATMQLNSTPIIAR